MYWKSFADFIAMGNHGVYVWASLGVFALLLTLEPLFIARGHTRLIARLRRELNIHNSKPPSARPAPHENRN